MKNISLIKPTESSISLGGKANNLMLLEELDVNIPQWVVLPRELMLSQLPENLTAENLQSSIESLTVPSSILDNMEFFFGAKYKSLSYAVRSSATDEDGKSFSFAGQFETKLNVSFDELLGAIKEVWKSVASDHVLAYRNKNNLDLNFGIAVIIQEMVQPDVSGVAFGLDPLTGNTSKKLVSAVYGLGEGLVSGKLNADNFTISPEGIEKKIAKKEYAFNGHKNKSGVGQMDIEESLQHKETLQDDQLIEINDLLDALNEMTGTPQDIEFAYANGKLHLLQTRPITTSLDNKDSEYNLWDNSNIVESYPGITTPLTYTFINKMYEAVYKQLTELMGVSKSQINRHSKVFENTLGLVRGRVYYNLVNWYKMLAMVPGYSINAGFMETMMGVKEKFELGDQFKMSKSKAWYRIIVMLFKMVKQHKQLPAERKRFQESLNVKLKKYNSLNYNEMSIQEIVEEYKTFETTLLKEWKAPLVNDFFSMIWFGLLKKQSQKLLPTHPNLHNDLLCGSQDIISVQPIYRTFEITNLIKADAIAKHLFTEIPAESIWEELQTGTFAEIKKAIDAYLVDFGERCIGELKLETTSYNQNPVLFIQVLKNYVANNVTAKATNGNIEKDLRQNAESLIFEQIKGSAIKKWWFTKVLNKARDLVSNRENLRYERTRAFGVVRKMFSAIGEKLYDQNVLENQKDVFYLELEEILSIGDLSREELFTEVKKRKAEFAAYELQDVPQERFYTYGYNFTDEYIYSNEKMEAITGDLQGIGCCPGQVKARVQVVTDPKNIESLNGDILVTTSTDPGWVTLFPSASAIIVERGSLLSHSAIVSREMGIPCIVSVDGLLRTLKTGDEILMDGSTGKIKVLNK